MQLNYDYLLNKGCLLYFIQALGLFLGGNFAILMMQAFSLTITLFIWDKIIAFYHEGRSRLICLGIALLLVLCFYDGGDLSEEWCLPYASYPIYLYFRNLKTNKEIRKIEMLVIGICFGIIVFIRINNASAFLGFIAYLYFVLLQKKEYKKLISNALLFLFGTLIIAGSCFMYFYVKAGSIGVKEMVYGTFLSYFEYFGYQDPRPVYYYVFYILFLFIGITLICINASKQNEILIPTLLSYAFFICSSGTRCFIHYLMVIIPLIVTLLTIIDFKKYHKTNLVLLLIGLFPLIGYLIRPVGFFFNDLVLNKEPFKTSYSEFHRCIEEIPKEERDSIYNYNLAGIGAGMMQHEGLLQCNKVLFSPLAFHLPTLHNEEVSKPFISPKWILISGDKWIYQDDILFIQENYDLIDYFVHNTQYIEGLDTGEVSTVCFYRRKD